MSDQSAKVRSTVKRVKPQPSIGFLELYAVVLSVYIWADGLSNKRVQLWTDNMSVVQVINSMTCKDKRMMTLVRILVRFCMAHNLKITMRHVPGVENIKADLLSRLQVERFQQMFGTTMDATPTDTTCKIWPYTAELWDN